MKCLLKMTLYGIALQNGFSIVNLLNLTISEMPHNSFRILSAADRPNYIGWTSNAYYQITQDRDMTEDTSLIFVMQVDFRHLLHSSKIHGNVATTIRP